LDHFISLPFNFLIRNLGFRILGAVVGSASILQSSVVKELHEDLWMLFNFPMITNLQTAFTMFSLCYAQRSSYLFFTMFPFPCILQHYTEFDTHAIIMLEMLLGAGSFGGSISPLTCRHATLLASSSKLGLPFVVWTISPTFLGC